jgi:hypothetical protein
MFFGFLIGTICLIGLIRAMSRRHWYGSYSPFGHSYGYAGHHGGCGGFRRGFGGHRGSWYQGALDAFDDEGPGWRGSREAPWGRGRSVIYSILGRIEATPAQEKVILSALDELKEAAAGLRGTGRDVRADVARAIRGSLLDDVALEIATARIDDAGLKLRAAVRAAVAKIHEVLDDRQRKMLADMVDSSWRAGW